MARPEVVLVPTGRSGRSMSGTLYVKSADGRVEEFSGYARGSIGWTSQYGSHYLAPRGNFTPFTINEDGQKVSSGRNEEGYRVDGTRILLHRDMGSLGCFAVRDWEGFKSFAGRGSPKFTIARTPPAWAGRGASYFARNDDDDDRSHSRSRHARGRDDEDGRYRRTRHDRDGDGIDDRLERRDRNGDGRDDRTGKRLHLAGVRYDGDADEIRAPDRQGGRQRVASREDSGGGIGEWLRGGGTNPFSRG